MGWAEDQAKKLIDSENALRMDREWQLHVSEVIRSEGPRLFELLGRKIKKNVSEFNSVLGEERMKCDVTAQRITVSIRRITETSLSLELKGSSVSANLREITTYYAENYTEWEMMFQVDRDNRISINGSTDLEQFSEGLLDTLLKGVLLCNAEFSGCIELRFQPSNPTKSFTSHNRSVTPAAIAGVMRRV